MNKRLLRNVKAEGTALETYRVADGNKERYGDNMIFIIDQILQVKMLLFFLWLLERWQL